jgi:hypothetical protein
VELEFESDEVKRSNVRVFRARAAGGWDNAYHFFLEIPANKKGTLRLLVSPEPMAKGQISAIQVRELGE